MRARTKNKKSGVLFKNMHLANKITLMYGCLLSIIILLLSALLMGNGWYYYVKLSKGELEQTFEQITEYIQKGGVISNEALIDLIQNERIGVSVIKLSDVRREEPHRESIYFPVPPPDAFYSEDEFGGSLADSGEMPKNLIVTARIRSVTQYMLADKIVEYSGEQYLVRLYRQNAKEWQILTSFGFVFVKVSVFSILIAFLIGRYISRAMLRPIGNITQTAGRINIEDLSERISIEGPDDEIKQLALTFNAMIERLEASFKKQNQFVSDASHELRTPISVIQGYANLMDRWGKKDEAVLQESIDSIKAETEHMGKLVKKLLFLAKGEQQKIQLQKLPLSLNLVADDIIKEAKAMEVKQDVVFSGEADQLIYADYDLIKQMLWIFLENSLKYSKENSRKTELRLYGDDKKCYCLIKDDGIGIAEEDIPYIFERFYRADKSRSKEVPGAGLGLSIADWILKQHDGTADIKSVYGEGTEITLAFPRYTDAAAHEKKE